MASLGLVVRRHVPSSVVTTEGGEGRGLEDQMEVASNAPRRKNEVGVEAT